LLLLSAVLLAVLCAMLLKCIYLKFGSDSPWQF
jgi:hypothetical protein